MSSALTQLQFRSLFDVTGERLYFNHAAFAPLSQPVVQAMQEFFRHRQAGNPKSWSIAEDHVEGLRQNYAKLIAAPSSRIALMANTVMGMNVLANGLHWQPGDHILLYQDEFPSNVMPYLNLRRQGVEVELLKAADQRVTPELFATAIRPETRLISVSSVQYLTGYHADLKALSDLCHSKNIIFAVDAVQSVGLIPTDVLELGIDFMAVGGHKWMMSPLGTGFLYLTEALQSRLEVIFRGYMGHENPVDYGNFNQALSTDARRFELGTFNASAMVGAEKAVQLLLDCGIENIFQHVRLLIRRLKQGLLETSFEPMYPYAESESSGIFLFTHHDPSRNASVFEKLSEQRVNISLRGGGLRFAPHYYNSIEEVDQFLDILVTLN